jgi:hypothetical protein
MTNKLLLRIPAAWFIWKRTKLENIVRILYVTEHKTKTSVQRMRLKCPQLFRTRAAIFSSVVTQQMAEYGLNELMFLWLFGFCQWFSFIKLCISVFFSIKVLFSLYRTTLHQRRKQSRLTPCTVANCKKPPVLLFRTYRNPIKVGIPLGHHKLHQRSESSRFCLIGPSPCGLFWMWTRGQLEETASLLSETREYRYCLRLCWYGMWRRLVWQIIASDHAAYIRINLPWG